MRIRSVLSALSVALMLVVGADYVTYAATGQSLVLGRANSANAATTIQRTTPGAALSLKVPSGAPPLAVNSSTRVPRLNADRVDGLEASQLRAKTYVSAFQPDACAGVTNVSGTWTKIRDIGSFTKAADATFVRLELASNFAYDEGSSTGAAVELRVDGKPTTIGRASLLLRQNGQSVPGTITGVFKGLAAGKHTVSVWGQGISGTASQVRVDSGCFNSAGVNNVLVTQFR